MPRDKSTDQNVMKRRGVKMTLGFGLCAIALLAAFEAGVMSGGLLVQRLSKEAGLRCTQLDFARGTTIEAHIFLRLKLSGALSDAEFAETTQDALRGDPLPVERIRELDDRLRESIDRFVVRKDASHVRSAGTGK